MGNTANFARKACTLFALSIGWTSDAIAAVSCPSPIALSVGEIDRKFEQRKYLVGLTAPLRSEGRLTATPEAIVWHMLEPFDVMLTITPDAITQSVDGGAPKAVDRGASALTGTIARTLTGLMRGQWSDLEATFEVEGLDAETRTAWTIELTPLEPRLGGVIGRIAVGGCREVDRVRIEHANGDRDEIHFEPSQPGAEAVE